jgi:hypothetical protein
MEHRVSTESSVPVENTKLALAGGWLFIPYKFVPARGRGNAAPFDSERAAAQRHSLAHALAPIDRHHEAFQPSPYH